MNRQEMIDALFWGRGGGGYGPCAVGGQMVMTLRADKVKSLVVIKGAPDTYTDDELAKLVEFSSRKSQEYLNMFRCSYVDTGANLIIIEKLAADYWIRKRMTWTVGCMASTSLADAMQAFERK